MMNIQRADVRGFTLLELLIVLVIAALLLALIQPMYSAAVPGARVKTEALELAVMLRDARNRAVGSGEKIDVRFDLESATYQIADQDPVNFSRGTSLTVRSRGSSHGQRHVVMFYPDGSSSGASIILNHPAAAWRVDVDWLTGRLRVTESKNEMS